MWSSVSWVVRSKARNCLGFSTNLFLGANSFWWRAGGILVSLDYVLFFGKKNSRNVKKKKKIVVLLLLGWRAFSTSLLSPGDLLVDGRRQRELPVNSWAHDLWERIATWISPKLHIPRPPSGVAGPAVSLKVADKAESSPRSIWATPSVISHCQWEMYV